MDNLIDKKALQEAFQKDIIIKIHAYERMTERNLDIHTIEETIKSDEIIEQYTDDYPIPSVLLLGKTISKDKVHIVCAPTDLGLVIITAYYPGFDSWDEERKKRKKKDEAKK